jgi:hypothetical protein
MATGALFLKALVASAADFDFLDPFGKENLVRGEASGRVGVKNRVDDIAALTLYVN